MLNVLKSLNFYFLLLFPVLSSTWKFLQPGVCGELLWVFHFQDLHVTHMAVLHFCNWTRPQASRGANFSIYFSTEFDIFTNNVTMHFHSLPQVMFASSGTHTHSKSFLRIISSPSSSVNLSWPFPPSKNPSPINTFSSSQSLSSTTAFNCELSCLLLFHACWVCLCKQTTNQTWGPDTLPASTLSQGKAQREISSNSSERLIQTEPTLPFLFKFLPRTLFLKIYLIIWLHWVFVAEWGHSLVALSGGCSCCTGFPLWWLL